MPACRQRSAAGWARLPGLAREMLGSFDFVAARSATDAARLTSLGAAHVTADGDLKLNGADLPFDEVEFARLQSLLGDRSALCSQPAPILAKRPLSPGCTMLSPWKHRACSPQSCPGTLSVAPRSRPNWGQDCAARVLRLRPACGSPTRWVNSVCSTACFPPCSWARVSCFPGGGQNPLEPARLGCSVAIGKLHDNFSDVVTLLQQAGTLEILADEAAALTWGRRMLAAPQRKAAAGLLGATPDLPAKLAARLAALIGVP